MKNVIVKQHKRNGRVVKSHTRKSTKEKKSTHHEMLGGMHEKGKLKDLMDPKKREEFKKRGREIERQHVDTTMNMMNADSPTTVQQSKRKAKTKRQHSKSAGEYVAHDSPKTKNPTDVQNTAKVVKQDRRLKK